MIEPLGDVAIIGGGCYGSFYTQQLEAARDAGAISYRRLLLIDQNANCQATSLPPASDREIVVAEWNAFLDGWLGRPERDRGDLPDMIVPSPLMPHLMASWLERQARQMAPDRPISLVPVEEPLGTPYDQLHVSGVRYVSFADWLCPTHCIEPALCPVIKAPRTWEMGDALTEWTAQRGREKLTAGPALFACRHVAYGVGMYRANLATLGRKMLTPLLAAPEGGDLVVGSISACHGAIGLLKIGPKVAPG